MEEYQKYVRRLAQERTGESFYNNSPSHAAVILEALLDNAREKVCLITTSLNPEVFGNEGVISAAQKFLSDGTHVMQILIETDPEESISTGHPLAQELVQHNTVAVRRLPPTLLTEMNYHFTVVDADSFRFEPNKSRWEASAAFGDAANGRKLQGVFDSLWEMSAPAHLPTNQMTS